MVAAPFFGGYPPRRRLRPACPTVNIMGWFATDITDVTDGFLLQTNFCDIKGLPKIKLTCNCGTGIRARVLILEQGNRNPPHKTNLEIFLFASP